MRGIFVVLEGSDGSGKSTVMEGLKVLLDKSDIPYVATREPGGTAIGEEIRTLLLDIDNQEMDAHCEALLYAASRAQHTFEKILPALASGKLVLTERYVLSSLAYQGKGRALGIEEVYGINAFATGGLKADLTLFLDADPLAVLDRKSRVEEKDRLEEAGDAFHARVFEGYKEAMQYVANLCIVDARKDSSAVIDECYKEIRKIWEERQ